WSVVTPAGGVVATGRETSTVDFVPGHVAEVGIARFEAPEVASPTRIDLNVVVSIGGAAVSENEWPLWVFPRRELAGAPSVRLVDPEGLWQGVELIVNVVDSSVDRSPHLCSEWTPETEAFVHAGGAALVLVRGRPDDLVPSLVKPFWREGVKVIEPHPAWGDFPHDGWTDLQFFGLTTDRVLTVDGERGHEPLLRRVDARDMSVNDYAVVMRIGKGRLLATTLRFAGGMGEQAMGLGRNICAQELLLNWIAWLAAE
ncbi:MAG TPA: hypothetical protein VFD39_05910, partial [Trueperaceae bacterium]|nr:hypothetical protein [Trueperaceae bacterium]